MDVEVVRDAGRTLEAQGIPLEKITAPQVRELTGYGSYTSIIERLRAIRGEVSGDDAPDPVEEAKRTLQHAQARLEALQAELPSYEHAMDVTREAVLNATARQLAAKECRWRGYWP